MDTDEAMALIDRVVKIQNDRDEGLAKVAAELLGWHAGLIAKAIGRR